MTNNSRAFAFVALAICVFLSGASRSAEQNAASAAEDEFLCEPVADDSNAVSIVKFTPSNNPQGESLDLVVPSELQGKKVVAIGARAFYNCDSLSSITLPEGVTTIGDGAFWYCGSLSSISLPESVTTIGKKAFEDCDSLTSISVVSANASYKDLDGVLCSKDGSRLIAYPSGRAAKDYVVPSGVTTIGAYAFAGCGSLRSISLPEGLKEIGEEAFARCGSLSSITLPESLKEIGEEAFYNCRSLSSISLPESVTRIGYRAFEGCSSDLTIVAPPGSYAARWAKSNDVRREAPPKR